MGVTIVGGNGIYVMTNLKSYKLRRSKADSCVYFEKELVVRIYVDDLLVMPSKDFKVQELKNTIEESLKPRT